MRVSHGVRSAFSGGRMPSDGAPPPYSVRVGKEVRKYPSYSRGQFLPHSAGSVVSLVTSTKRR